MSKRKSLHAENPVQISELKDMIRVAFASRRALMVWGPPGVGKSEAVEQIADEQNRPLIDLRLLLMEPTDLRGIPFKTEIELIDENTREVVRDKEGNAVMTESVRWAVPEELPRPGYKENAILFLDEISAAPPMVQAAAYQLVLNRRIGPYVLPDGVDIIAAGNRQSDKGVAFKMPTPLANRFIHCTLECSFSEWKDWAISSGKVEASIIAYHIEGGGKNLLTFDPGSNSEIAFATPRSWVFASDVLRNSSLSRKMTTKLIAGCIGEGLAGEFMQFRKLEDQIPKTEDILRGKITAKSREAKEIKDLSAKYLVIVNMCHYLKSYFQEHNLTSDTVQGKRPEFEKVKKDLVPMCDNFMEFVMDAFEDELSILALRTALFNYDLPFPYNDLKSFSRFVKDYKEFIL